MRTITLQAHTKPTHKHTHTKYHQGPAMEGRETHFFVVNMKSWMCHSVLSAIQRLASADIVYITHVSPPWHTSLREIGDSINITCHLISALRQSLSIWQSAFYEMVTAGQQAGRFPDTVTVNISCRFPFLIAALMVAEWLRLHGDNECRFLYY